LGGYKGGGGGVVMLSYKVTCTKSVSHNMHEMSIISASMFLHFRIFGGGGVGNFQSQKVLLTQLVEYVVPYPNMY